MKKIMMVLTIALGLTATAANSALAQVNIQINIGQQPGWGPTGYDHVDFYYLPELNCYYDVMRGQFIIPVRNSWVYSRTVPAGYRNIDLYRTYKVVVNQSAPYRYNSSHMRQYARYRTNHNQLVIRNSKDYKYYQSAGHPNHNQWRGNNGNVGRNTGNTVQVTNTRSHTVVRTSAGTSRTEQSVRTQHQRTGNNRGQR